MTDNEMIYCLIAFILGWFVSRMMGNGFSVGGESMREEQRRIQRLEKGYDICISKYPNSIKDQVKNCNCKYICKGLSGLEGSYDECIDYINNYCPDIN